MRAIDAIFRAMNKLSQPTNFEAQVAEATHVLGLLTELMLADCGKRLPASDC